VLTSGELVHLVQIHEGVEPVLRSSAPKMRFHTKAVLGSAKAGYTRRRPGRQGPHGGL